MPHTDVRSGDVPNYQAQHTDEYQLPDASMVGVDVDDRWHSDTGTSHFQYKDDAYSNNTNSGEGWYDHSEISNGGSTANAHLELSLDFFPSQGNLYIADNNDIDLHLSEHTDASPADCGHTDHTGNVNLVVNKLIGYELHCDSSREYTEDYGTYCDGKLAIICKSDSYSAHSDHGDHSEYVVHSDG